MKSLNNEKLYYIGGIVRDEILGIPCFDVDVTFEGNAIEYSKIIDCEVLQVNDEFGTVKIKIDDKVIDLASTRDEDYPQKGHLPVVNDIGCSLKRDVLRRDFTINAIAKSVMSDEIIDYTGGLNDIKLKLLRVLHDGSFVDDPSRIVRGLKFAVRFGFELEEHTLELQENYLKNVNRDMSYKRLKKELMETFNLNSQSAYERFFDLGIYRLLSDSTPDRHEFDIEGLVNKYPVNNVWMVYLGYMALDSLPLTKIEKKIVEDYRFLIGSTIPQNDFEVYKLFEKREREAILLYTIVSGSDVGLRYFAIKDIKLAISGKDLIGFGVQPSPEFEKCFDYVLKRKLNDPSMSYEDELALAKEYFRGSVKGF